MRVMGRLGCEALSCAIGLVMLRLGLLERDLVVAGIELHQQLACLDDLVVVHMDGLDGAVDARGDRVQMPVNLGVIRVFIALGVEVPADADGQQHKHDRPDDEGIDAALLLRRSSFCFEAGIRLALGGGIRRRVALPSRFQRSFICFL